MVRTGAARAEGSIGSQEFLGPISVDEWDRIDTGIGFMRFPE